MSESNPVPYDVRRPALPRPSEVAAYAVPTFPESATVAARRWFPRIWEHLSDGDFDDIEWDEISLAGFLTDVREHCEAIDSFVGLAIAASFVGDRYRAIGKDRHDQMALEWLGRPEGVEAWTLSLGLPGDRPYLVQRNTILCHESLRHWFPDWEARDGWLVSAVADSLKGLRPVARLPRGTVRCKSIPATGVIQLLATVAAPPPRHGSG